MDIQDSIIVLNLELGKTQIDIAKALHISVGTVADGTWHEPSKPLCSSNAGLLCNAS